MADKMARNFFSRWLGEEPQPETPAVPAAPVLPGGLTAIEESHPDDIFIVGYPKSGNTWSQCLISAAVYGVDLDLAPYGLVKDLVPDVHDRTCYRRYSKPTFFKSHALPDARYRNVIYLLRDGRDVMVSYFHFLEALHGESLDFCDWLRTGKHMVFGPWHEHVRQWLANSFESRMIVVRYEDMKSDPVGQLRRMCEFAGVERDTALLEKATQQASFENLRRRETQWNTGEGRWPKDKHFFRRGIAGAYADEMPAEALRLFEEQAGEMLAATGYTAAAPPA
jgi:hypothetical protein